MKDYVKRMITEHKELSEKIINLKSFIRGENGINVFNNIENNKTQGEIINNMADFANICMQLHTMEQYLGLLDVRLHNEGIIFRNGQYTPVSVEPLGEDEGEDKCQAIN